MHAYGISDDHFTNASSMIGAIGKREQYEVIWVFEVDAHLATL